MTLNEAVEVARAFGTDKSAAFVNGVLDAVLRELRETDRMKKSGPGPRHHEPGEKGVARWPCTRSATSTGARARSTPSSTGWRRTPADRSARVTRSSSSATTWTGGRTAPACSTGRSGWRRRPRPARARSACSSGGNHDQMMLDYAAGTGDTEVWWMNGGRTTLAAYQERGDLVLPQDHLGFLHRTPLVAERDGFAFVHAGLDTRRTVAENLADPDPGIVLWTREHLARDLSKWETPVVCGHTPVPEPINTPHLIGIDTGAVFAGRPGFGRLTAVALPERPVRRGPDGRGVAGGACPPPARGQAARRLAVDRGREAGAEGRRLRPHPRQRRRGRTRGRTRGGAWHVRTGRA